PGEKHWHSDVVMSLAGAIAQAKFEKDDWREHVSPGDKSCIAFDRRKLGDKARTSDEYEAECRKLVEQHWTLIEAVAEKLLKEETLSGSDVSDICWRTARNVVRRQHLKSR